MRKRFWVAGLVLGGLGAVFVPESAFPGARLVAFAALAFAIGLVGEGMDLIRRAAPEGPRDRRPPDGRVDVARLAAIRRVVNTHDDRFGAYAGEEPGATPPRTRRPSASVGPLRGRLVLFSLFLGTRGRSWTDAEIAEAHRALERAGRWIEREAGRHEADVNVELADVYFAWDDPEPDEVAVDFAPEGDDMGPLERDATFKALRRFSRASVDLGFRDAVAFVRAIASRVEADTTAWLVHPCQAGRSFAIPEEFSQAPGLALAVCYPEEASFPEPLRGRAYVDPVTIVHELLHLYGASDKYGLSLDAFPRGHVSEREVMRLDVTRLSQLKVDPLTAAEIGWI